MEQDNKIIELESEFKVLKGEIKKLLVDLREIMNNAENPFCNINLDDLSTLEDECAENPEKTAIIESHCLNETPLPSSNVLDTVRGPAAGSAEYAGNIVKSPYLNETPFPSSNVLDTVRVPADESTANKEKTVKSSYLNETPLPSSKLLYAVRGPAAGSAEKYEELMSPEAKDQTTLLSSLTDKTENNLVIYIELMRWVDSTLCTIDKPKLKELLELYELMVHLPKRIKEIITKIIDLSTEKTTGYRASMKDYVNTILQLNAILNPTELDQRLIPIIYEGIPWGDRNDYNAREFAHSREFAPRIN